MKICPPLHAVVLLGVEMVLAGPSAKADVIYEYTGTPFTTCTYGTCPTDFTSDYIIATISFADPLAANLPEGDVTSYTGWTIGDALGNFLYSSSNPSTSGYLTGFPPGSVPPLELATDGSGNIVAWEMSAFPAEILDVPGLSEALIVSPPVTITDSRLATLARASPADTSTATTPQLPTERARYHGASVARSPGSMVASNRAHAPQDRLLLSAPHCGDKSRFCFLLLSDRRSQR